MNLFAPKRLIIKPQSKHSLITNQIIERTRRYNPTVAVEYLKGKDFTYPVDSPREKFLYMKESAIISERAESFIRTFDSPGNIVESLTTVLNLSWMCANRCEFCYLQTNQTPEHYFYTNLRDAEHEIASSRAAHAAILTLWTHLSDYFGQRLMKLPDRFKETADWIREYYVRARVTIDSDAIDRYHLMQRKLAGQLNEENRSYKVEESGFIRDRATIERWYNENLKYPLRLTVSEFNDFLAVDHLTNNSSFLMRMVGKYPSFRFTLRSRSSFVDGFVPYDGLGRAKFHIALNTERAIQAFEHGTATLDERLHAARKLQEARGYRLGLVLEPMLIYDNYLEEYRQLIHRALTQLDPSRIENVILGSLRFTAQLKAMTKVHFPDTTLFEGDQACAAPAKPDTKYRYTPSIREHLYSTLIAEVRSLSNLPIGLGSETPDLWETLSLGKDQELGNTVFEPPSVVQVPAPSSAAGQDDQHISDQVTDFKPRKDLTKMEPPRSAPDEADPPDTGEQDGPHMLKPYWISISPQELSVIEAILSERDEYVPSDRFKSAIDKLRSMVTIREHTSAKADELVGYSVADGWSIREGRPLNELLTRQVYYEPVKFIGKISHVSPFTPHEIPDRGTMGFVNLTLTDTAESHITTLDIHTECVTIDLATLHRERTRCAFFGSIVPFYNKSGKGTFKFYLHDIATGTRPIDLVGWTPADEDQKGFGVVISGRRYGIPKDHPTSIIRRFFQPGAVISHIKEELARGLGIQALDQAVELQRALEFVILQGLSQGRGETLEKLHSLVIGPPNVGKSYLTKAALILNTQGQEISSNSRKATEAGLIGTVRNRSKGKNISEPGILPLNHGGVVCIQEFHDIRGPKRQSICGMFVRMMEEGRVIDSTSADTVHPAETALLIDMNRYSQLNPSIKFDSFTDIDIPINMLARFDYIVEIPRDEKRSKTTATEMVKGLEVMGGGSSPSDEYWKMRLKYLVAYLKTEYRVVQLSDVGTYIEAQVDAMLANVPARLKTLVEDMRLRIVRSAFKLTKAVATANASRVATRGHADYALRFVQDKVNFIRSIKLEDIRAGKPDIGDRAKRLEIIETNFAGKPFQIDDVARVLLEQMEGERDKRSIQRDLKALGAKALSKPKGSWSLKVKKRMS